jgi:hypothetical protein
MTHNIIKTENYLLVVNDSEIKEGDWIYESDSNSVNIAGKGYHNFTQSDAKIIAHLPLNNSPVLEGVPLLPPLEDEVGGLSEQEFPYIKDSLVQTTKSEQNKHTDTLRWGFKKGYNKAKEKYKYTEEDMRKALSESFKASQDGYNITSDEIIQSLQQPKMPVGFECEVERIYPNPQTISKEYDFDDILIERKTTTNSQGQTVWVGKYIY